MIANLSMVAERGGSFAGVGQQGLAKLWIDPCARNDTRTDVRADLAGWREERGLPADPMKAYAESGYQSRINNERVGGHQAGWGA